MATKETKSGFEAIEDIHGLIDYLTKSDKKKGQYICQYTQARTLQAVLSNKRWYIGNPINMNDGLEYQQQNKEAWKNIFFASFMNMGYENESIAMWSMYGQPWEDGVCIAFDKNEFYEWIKMINKGECKVHKADPRTKQILETETKPEIKAYPARVAYYSSDPKTGEQKLTYSTKTNTKIFESYHGEITKDSSAIGYIKDSAWDYEKEIRLRIELSGEHDWEGLLVDIPDRLISTIMVKTSPRFSFRSLDISRDQITSSKFQGKLNWIYCDGCYYKSVARDTLRDLVYSDPSAAIQRMISGKEYVNPTTVQYIVKLLAGGEYMNDLLVASDNMDAVLSDIEQIIGDQKILLPEDAIGRFVKDITGYSPGLARLIVG